MERYPYRPTPTTPHEALDNTWNTDVFEHLLSPGDSAVVDITVEGPPLDPPSEGISTSLSNSYHDMSTIHYGHNEIYLTRSTPQRRNEHIPPGRCPGLQLSNSYSGIRSNSFTGYPTSVPHLRTHSDTTQSRSRPQFNLQSYQLMDSAVEDSFSAVELFSTRSTASSPTHSGHDPHSPVPPWGGTHFLAPPAQTFGPHAQSFRDSDTSSNQSSSPNLDYSAVSFDFEGALSEPQDNSLHPPMLPPPVWDPNYLAPGMLYRNADTGSLFSSDDTSSVGPPSPITEWDLGSVSDVYFEDTSTNAQDDNSPETNSSNETEHPASRLDKDFTEKLQLQEGPSTSTSASTSVYPFETSTTDVLYHIDAHRPTTGSEVFGFGTHDPFSRSEAQGEGSRFRSVVSTEAGRRASGARRKGPARFSCEYCGATLTAKHNLRNHLKSHTLTKDCICETCGRGFGTKHVLKRHEPKCNARRGPSGRSSKASRRMNATRIAGQRLLSNFSHRTVISVPGASANLL
ncbi:hypothetical protein C8R45DRAFT_961165 [Mycena sanguinolenta]|nr:hypothetical protein C8R45DRAFT_961165 [Mycena sanguinolenta]